MAARKGYIDTRQLLTADSTRQRLGMEFALRRKQPERYMSLKVGNRRYIAVRGGMTRKDAEALAEKYRRMSGYLAQVRKDPSISYVWVVYVWRGD